MLYYSVLYLAKILNLMVLQLNEAFVRNKMNLKDKC